MPVVIRWQRACPPGRVKNCQMEEFRTYANSHALRQVRGQFVFRNPIKWLRYPFVKDMLIAVTFAPLSGHMEHAFPRGGIEMGRYRRKNA